YGLLGPNGSGKTTLIRSLVGLVEVDAGTIEVLGLGPADLALLDRIGYMTQAAALYDDLSVDENIRFFAEVYGASASDVTDALRLIRSGKLIAEGTADELRRLAGVDRLEDAFLRLSAR